MVAKAQIIDVFAGPGGLGEGFAAFKDEHGEHPFEIKVSVEMEKYAHSTLRLRAFVRYFIQQDEKLPKIYIRYLSGECSLLKKLLEFREVVKVTTDNRPLSENEVEERALIFPQSYCPKEYELAKELYRDEWDLVSKAITNALSEALRMTLGEDESSIHEAIRKRIDSSKPKILIGGPPCQAFSMVGRSRRKGNVTKHVILDEEGKGEWNLDDDGRTWLYLEYIKIIQEFQPDIFVMENVRGMMSAMVNGEAGEKIHVWKKIFADLHNPGVALGLKEETLRYDIYSLAGKASYKGGEFEFTKLKASAFVLHAEEYGIPQIRERVILLGIKKDVSKGLMENFSTYLERLLGGRSTTVQDAIGDLPALRAGLGCIEHFELNENVYKTTRSKVKKEDEKVAWKKHLSQSLKNTRNLLRKSAQTHQGRILDLLNISQRHFTSLFDKSQSIEFVDGQNYESTNTSLAKFNDIAEIRLIGDEQRAKNSHVQELMKWYGNLYGTKFVLNHEARSHMDSDLCRYIYSASYALIKTGKDERSFPCLPELEEVDLAPKGHKNKQSFIDRFRTQILDKPATTVTSHISKDGHYYIHPDPSQMRSLTVREAARIQTFPDNYFFEGPRTAQFIQVGNAVPPFLAFKIAEVVYKVLLKKVNPAEQLGVASRDNKERLAKAAAKAVV